MKLLLTSSGITNKSIENALRQLLGKPFAKSCVTFIPTAATVEKGDKSWLVDDMCRIKKLGFASFDICDIAIAPKDVWFSSFENADLLVFGGGNVDYLLEWMDKSGVRAALPELLKTTIYMGISAGSMVAATTVSLASSDILYYEKTNKLEETQGLSLIDFEIRPHLNSQWFPKVRLEYLEKLAKETPNAFYATDDATAIQVVDGDITVVSEGEWKKFDK